MDSEPLCVVSSNNVEIFRHLGSSHLKRAAIEHHVGADAESLRKLVREKIPNLVILDTILPGGSGYDLCRELKDDPTLGHMHVIILQGSLMDMETVSKTAACGCDDVLSLPLHPDDFYYHLAQITGVSLRTSHRVATDMTAILEREGKVINGKIFNVSNQGIGLEIAEELPLGPIEASLVQGDERYDGISGQIVWCTKGAGGYTAGLHFEEIPPITRSLLARLSLYQIHPNETGEGLTVIMQGRFDEQTDFGPLYVDLKDARSVDFMLNGVQYLSSLGVQAWCLFLNKLDPATSYSFRNCSLEFASQAAMVPLVVGRGAVLSVQAPYFCEACDREETRLVESALVKLSDGSVHAPELHCHLCSGALTFDDLPNRYFAFLSDS